MVFWAASPPQTSAGPLVASGVGNVGHTVQWQPVMQVVGFMPVLAATSMSGIAGLAQGVAGLAIASRAPLSSRGSRVRRSPARCQTQEEAAVEIPHLSEREHPDDQDSSESYPISQESPKFSDCSSVPFPQRPSDVNTAQNLDYHELLELKQKLEAGEDSRQAALEEIASSILQFAFDSYGCRIVQIALDVADKSQAEELVAGLHGHVREAVGSPHANYVIQKVIETLPSASARFVLLELEGAWAEVVTHRYGCRIVCRLLEHSVGDDSTLKMIDEVLSHVYSMSKDRYGRHVVQAILEHGQPHHKAKIIDVLSDHSMHLSKDRNANFVVEKALACASPRSGNALAAQILSRPEDLAALAQSKFGQRVVKALSEFPGNVGQTTSDHLRLSSASIRASKQGRRLLSQLTKAA